MDTKLQMEPKTNEDRFPDVGAYHCVAVAA
jgi:hypothetical protein